MFHRTRYSMQASGYGCKNRKAVMCRERSTRKVQRLMWHETRESVVLMCDLVVLPWPWDCLKALSERSKDISFLKYHLLTRFSLSLSFSEYIYVCVGVQPYVALHNIYMLPNSYSWSVTQRFLGSEQTSYSTNCVWSYPDNGVRKPAWSWQSALDRGIQRNRGLKRMTVNSYSLSYKDCICCKRFVN